METEHDTIEELNNKPQDRMPVEGRGNSNTAGDDKTINTASTENVITNTKQLTVDNSEENLSSVIVIPTENVSKVIAFNKELENSKVVLSRQEELAIGLVQHGLEMSESDKMLEELSNKEGLVSSMHIDGEDIGTREIHTKVREGRKVRGRTAKSIAYSFLGVGGNIQIPLWHSGFHIVLDTIGSNARIALNFKLAEHQRDIGANTAGLAYSNDTAVLARVFMEFIEEHTIKTSLKMEEDKSLRDYIKVQDFLPMINMLILALSPKGFDITMSCHNTTVIEGEAVKCDKAITGRFSAKEILKVNKNALNGTAKAIIAKRLPDSVTPELIEEYQDQIAELSEVTKTYDVGDNVATITYHSPNMAKYIDMSQLWLTDLESEVDKIIMSDEDSEREAALNSMTQGSLLNIYNHFVKEIRLEDTVIDRDSDIVETLSAFTLNDTLIKQILDDMKEYVNKSVIAMVGTPVYTCPKCRKGVQDSENKAPAFSGLIPINPISIFFALRSLSILKMDKALSTKS